MRNRTMKRVAAILAAASLVLTGLVAFAHLPAGRAILRILSGAKGGCPFGAQNADPAKLEAVRKQGVAPLKGDGAAASKALLGFDLASGTRASVDAWAAANGVSCREEAKGAAMRCLSVPASAFAYTAGLDGLDIDDLFFRFDARGKLVAVDAMRKGLDAESSAQRLAAARAHFEKTLGRVAVIEGRTSADYLGGGSLQRGAVTFRFSDWALDVSAMSYEGAVTFRVQSRAL